MPAIKARAAWAKSSLRTCRRMSAGLAPTARRRPSSLRRRRRPCQRTPTRPSATISEQKGGDDAADQQRKELVRRTWRAAWRPAFAWYSSSGFPGWSRGGAARPRSSPESPDAAHEQHVREDPGLGIVEMPGLEQHGPSEDRGRLACRPRPGPRRGAPVRGRLRRRPRRPPRDRGRGGSARRDSRRRRSGARAGG